MNAHLLAGLAALFASSAALAVTPNQYACEGDGLSATLTRATQGGAITLAFKKGETQWSKTGDLLTVEQTQLGELTTALVRAIPDYKTETVSLLIPEVKLTGVVNEVEFDTVLVQTTKHGGMGGGIGLAGLIVDNATTPVKCRATYEF